jgi:hypothetical protein
MRVIATSASFPAVACKASTAKFSWPRTQGLKKFPGMAGRGTCLDLAGAAARGGCASHRPPRRVSADRRRQDGTSSRGSHRPRRRCLTEGEHPPGGRPGHLVHIADSARGGLAVDSPWRMAISISSGRARRRVGRNKSERLTGPRIAWLSPLDLPHHDLRAVWGCVPAGGRHVACSATMLASGLSELRVLG